MVTLLVQSISTVVRMVVLVLLESIKGSLEDGTASAVPLDDGRSRRLSGLSSRRVAVVFAAAAADAARPPRPRFRLGPLLLLLGQAARPAPPLGQAGDDGLGSISTALKTWPKGFATNPPIVPHVVLQHRHGVC